jgi:TonB-linked SusC/RagA family outer membrane protein
MKKIVLLLFLLIGSTVFLSAQKVINGKVTDEDQSPLPGVSVVAKGTNIGTLTDIDGQFSLQVPQGANILTFSFIGMKRTEVEIGTQTFVSVVMSVDVGVLDEVVVIGYGTIKKSDLTGSISSVKGDNIRLQAVGNVVQSLSGVAAGVQVLQTSGQPGSSTNVVIRGGNSLLGDNNPLYIVDGTPMITDLSMFNTNDIESIEILKDASGTAIYGSRGANGVVLVTTKKGKAGATNIEYSGYYGMQQVTKKIDMLNAEEFALLVNERYTNDGLTPYFSASQIASFGEGFNWQDAVFQIAPIQNHSLRLSGGTDKTTYSVSGSYFGQEGIIINSGYNNLQLRTRLDTKITKDWTFSINTVLSRRTNKNVHSNNTERGMGVLSAAVGCPPTIPDYDENGDYSFMMPYPFSPEGLDNPIAMAYEKRMLNSSNDLSLNLSTSVNILRDLTFYSSLGIQYDNAREDFYSGTKLFASRTGTATIGYSELMNILNENTLTYKKVFADDHDVTLLGGVTAQKNSFQDLEAGSTGYLTDILQNYSLQSGESYQTPTSSISDWTLLSYLSRINYSFRSKYLFTASIRADGSSRFGSKNRWGYFPSFAIGWNISEENFLRGNPTLNNLKLRLSWGQTGNTSISPYQSLSVLSSIQTVFDDNLNIGYAPGSIMPNPELKWETTSQANAGIDAGFLSDRITLSADFYYKVTKDLLVNIPVTPSSGYTSQTTNLGNIENKGLELALNWRVIDRDFSWNIGSTFTLNRNKVLSLPQGGDIFGTTIGWVLPAMNLVREGYPVGVFYGYIEDGLKEDGNIKYVDLYEDGTINTLDRTIIGDPNPDYIFGINSDMSYRNFGLTLLINGVQGNDILNYNMSNIGDSFSYGINQIQDILGNYWTASNPDPNAKYPRISKDTRFLGSDRFVEDGSYIQLKNIKLSYSLSGDKFKAFKVYNSQVFISLQNLLTITKYSFFTPIQNTLGTGINKGIDKWGYPDARIFMIGVMVNL